MQLLMYDAITGGVMLGSSMMMGGEEVAGAMSGLKANEEQAKGGTRASMMVSSCWPEHMVSSSTRCNSLP
jgi:hypothetical protein